MAGYEILFAFKLILFNVLFCAVIPLAGKAFIKLSNFLYEGLFLVLILPFYAAAIAFFIYFPLVTTRTLEISVNSHSETDNYLYLICAITGMIPFGAINDLLTGSGWIFYLILFHVFCYMMFLPTAANSTYGAKFWIVDTVARLLAV